MSDMSLAESSQTLRKKGIGGRISIDARVYASISSVCF
jgi:hypothetical protein